MQRDVTKKARVCDFSANYDVASVSFTSLALARLSRTKERVWSNCILCFEQACQEILGVLIGLSTAVTYCDSLLRIKLVTLKV